MWTGLRLEYIYFLWVATSHRFLYTSLVSMLYFFQLAQSIHHFKGISISLMSDAWKLFPTKIVFAPQIRM